MSKLVYFGDVKNGEKAKLRDGTTVLKLPPIKRDNGEEVNALAITDKRATYRKVDDDLGVTVEPEAKAAPRTPSKAASTPAAAE